MTALCAGGSSAKQSGFAETIIGTATVIDAILLQFGGLWLLPFVALVDIEAFDLTTLCITDPPALPTFTAADVLALSNYGDLPAQASVLSKIKDAVNHYAWYQFCQCTSGTLTPAPSFPAQPSDVQIPTAPSSQACWSFDWQGTPPVTPSSDEANGATYLLTLLPPGSANTVHPPGLSIRPVRLVQGLTPSWIRYHYTQQNPHGSQVDGVVMEFFDINKNTLGTRTLGGNAGTQIEDGTVDVPTSTAYWTLYVCDPSPTIGTGPITVHADFYCGGSVPGGATTPCTTDPAVMAALRQILGELGILLSNAGPPTYTTGTAHSGLSGSGFISVGILAGVQVQITTLPTALGRTIGDPDWIFDAGRINLGSTAGFGPPLRITSEDFVTFDVSPFITTIGYTFHPGVVATITELLTGP